MLRQDLGIEDIQKELKELKKQCAEDRKLLKALKRWKERVVANARKELTWRARRDKRGE
jgi:ribosomal 50S subunit-associated protein YjgA (DUF615 family)